MLPVKLMHQKSRHLPNRNLKSNRHVMRSNWRRSARRLDYRLKLILSRTLCRSQVFGMIYVITWGSLRRSAHLEMKYLNVLILSGNYLNFVIVAMKVILSEIDKSYLPNNPVFYWGLIFFLICIC